MEENACHQWKVVVHMEGLFGWGLCHRLGFLEALGEVVKEREQKQERKKLNCNAAPKSCQSTWWAAQE
jgi:hypothetical protein